MRLRLPTPSTCNGQTRRYRYAKHVAVKGCWRYVDRWSRLRPTFDPTQSTDKLEEDRESENIIMSHIGTFQ